MDDTKPTAPQIKVCGLTVPEEAAACAALGADAVGLVFFPPSPRHVTLAQAARITALLPERVRAAGVFVDPDRGFLAEAIRAGRLRVVQLHGQEPPELAAWIQDRYAVTVLKALFMTKKPALTAAVDYPVPAFLVECGQGPLPGGNALQWDWGAAADFARRHPTVLAGGLDADNVAQAIAAAMPQAVDASSGLEAAPGRKDLKKVERFVAAVRGTAALYRERARKLNPVF